MTTYQELEQYHNELIRQLRASTTNWMHARSSNELHDAQKGLLTAIEETDRAFHAIRAQLVSAPGVVK